jgi:hypothetical protein
VAANDLGLARSDRVESQFAGAPETSCREREISDPMNETGTRQSGYSVFGIRPVAEFARYLIEAPRPRLSVEQKARDRVVDLILREAGASALVWNTLLLHGKVLPFRATPPGQFALSPGAFG